MNLILEKGLNAAKKNAGPGLLLQAFALMMVLLYYFHAPTREIILKIPEIARHLGVLFPILVTSFSGGLIPFIFMVSRKEIARGRYLANLLFMLIFWAVDGLIVDVLYKAQAKLFGDQSDTFTIIKKVCVDQFIFNPLWAVPLAVFAMHWKHCDFSFKIAKTRFSGALFTENMVSILLATWSVWIPAVAIIYSLPLALQFPLFNLALCFWSLLLTALSKKGE